MEYFIINFYNLEKQYVMFIQTKKDLWMQFWFKLIKGNKKVYQRYYSKKAKYEGGEIKKFFNIIDNKQKLYLDTVKSKKI